MKKIALCGPSGVGKGFVSEIICKEFGFPVLDTDKVVHEMYESDKTLISSLGEIFGDSIIKDGKINRNALREIVFKNRAALEMLNHTVHQRVRDYIQAWFDQMEKKGCSACFVDIPQIIESGMVKDFDLVIGICADMDIRLNRITRRDGISIEDARKRISNQLGISEYLNICHHRLDNNGNKEKLISDIYSVLYEVGIIE